LKVAELFYSIQGEGKLSGVPSVFVRASGCNLRCVWCDTPYASWNPQGTELSVAQIMDQVKIHPARHVVLTGGEPAIMADFLPLCAALKENGYHVTVETAATVFSSASVDLASLSPKLANSTPHHREGGKFAAGHEKHRLNPSVIQKWIDQSPDFQLKFVVCGPNDLQEIKAILSGLSRWSPADVLLMPEGVEQSVLQAHSAWIAQTCMETGFRYCPRLHIALFGNQRGT
jgi:7-carboxy-7-deazaguanine synthase